MRHLERMSVFFMALLLTVTVGCGGSETTTVGDQDADQQDIEDLADNLDDQLIDQDDDTVVADGDLDSVADGDSDASNEEFVWEQPDVDVAGFGFRFTALTWEQAQIKMEMTGVFADFNAIANDEMAKQIDSNSLNIIYATASENLTAWSYEAVLGMSDFDGSVLYNFEQAQQFTISHNDCTACTTLSFISGKQNITVPIPLQGGVTVPITLKEATMRGSYTNTQDGVVDGVIAGALPRSDAQKITFSLGAYGSLNLDDLLYASSLRTDTTCLTTTLEDGSAAWVFVFRFTAQREQFGTPLPVDGDTDPDQDRVDEAPDFELPEYEQPDVELNGYGYRVTALTWNEAQAVITYIVKIELHTVANSQYGFSAMIQQGNLNLLLAPATDDVLVYPYQAVFGQGEAATGGYSIDQLQAFDISQKDVSNVHGFTSSSARVIIPIPMQGGQSFNISLEEATISGTYSGDGSLISAGNIHGLLPRTYAQAINIPYVNQTLDTVLANTKALGTYKVNTAQMQDGSEAWVFDFSFDAAKVTIVP